ELTTRHHEAHQSRAYLSKCGCRWCVLKCRAMALAHDDYPEPGWVWAGEPLNHLNNAKYTFRRGFVEEITCDWPTWGGGECGHCRRGRIERDVVLGGRLIVENTSCPHCSNTGRIQGHADA